MDLTTDLTTLRDLALIVLDDGNRGKVWIPSMEEEFSDKCRGTEVAGQRVKCFWRENECESCGGDAGACSGRGWEARMWIRCNAIRC